MASATAVFKPRALLFWGSGAVALGSSGILFRDLTDFSQWVKKPSRNNVWKTYQNRHELAALCMMGSSVNMLTYLLSIVGQQHHSLQAAASGLANRPFSPLALIGINGASMGMFFLGYFNNELMFRERNRNALYVSTRDAGSILKDSDMAIVTQLDDAQEPVCFPDAQITRPHVARVGYKRQTNGTQQIPVTIAYCGLTGTGMVYETPNLPDGREREFFALTQLENNLVVMDRTTGAIGHQINGLNETLLLEKIAAKDTSQPQQANYDLVGRRPEQAVLQELGVEPAQEVPSWRMTVGQFQRAFPRGKVFINDYKEFPDVLHQPVLSLYDKLIDFIFYIFVDQIHNKMEAPLFPTITNKDSRLPNKTRVWGFNVGDDYVAITEHWVKKGPNGTRNFSAGSSKADEKHLVASWDVETESLGVWVRPNDEPIADAYINVHGQVVPVAAQAGHTPRQQVRLERLNTVKAGLFWFSWANFFPQTRLNPRDIQLETKPKKTKSFLSLW